MTPTAESKPDPAEIAAGLSERSARTLRRMVRVGTTYHGWFDELQAFGLCMLSPHDFLALTPTPLGRAVAAHLEASK